MIKILLSLFLTVPVLAAETRFQPGDYVKVGKCRGVVVEFAHNHYKLMAFRCSAYEEPRVRWVHTDDIEGKI